MGCSINELLAKALSIQPPTSEAEVHRRYIALMERLSTDHGLTSQSEVEEAVRSRLITDDALLEEWILVRQAREALESEGV